MTTQKLFKRRVRDRMAKTGERYAAARSQAARVQERLKASTGDLAGALELASDSKIREATGRSWETWLSLLDRWGARRRKRGETVDFLIADQGVSGWWAQAIATGYQRTRGMRLKHQQPDGFTIYVSKTFGVSIDHLFDAFTDGRTRRRWLTDGPMSLRNTQRGKIARFEWADGRSRVSVTFEARGPTKSTAYVAHERLPDPDAAEAAKAAWKPRLAALKAFLESTDV